MSNGRNATVNFRIQGIADMMRAFRSVEQASARASKSTVDHSKKADKELEKLRKKLEREDAATNKRIEKDHERSKARQKQIDDKAARDAATSMKRREKEELDSMVAVSRGYEREMAKRESARERDARLAITNAEKQASKLIQIEKRRTAAIEKAGRDRGRSSDRFAGTVSGAIGSAVSTAGALVGGVTALGGGFTAVGAIQEQISAKGKAKSVSQQSGGAVTRDQVFGRAEEVSKLYGVATTDIIDALDAFGAKSGDYKAGFDAIQGMVELAIATGGDLKDIAKAGGSAYNGTGGGDAANNYLAELAGYGRQGSVDMKDLAQYAPRIVGSANAYEDKRGAMSDLAISAQIAAQKGTATDAAEATTGVGNIARDLAKHSEGITTSKAEGGLGIKTRTGGADSGYRSVKDIAKDLMSSTKGDMEQYVTEFTAESQKVLMGYANLYKEGVKSAGPKASAADKDKAGLANIDKYYNSFADNKMTSAQAKTEAQDRMKETDKELEKAMNDLKILVANELVPELVRLMPKIKELVPVAAKLITTLVELATWLASNPFAAIVTLILGNLAKALAVDGIKSMLSAAISAMAGGGKVPGGGPGGGAAAALGPVGAIVTTAAVIGAVSKEAIDTHYDGVEKKGGDVFKGAQDAIIGGRNAAYSSDPADLYEQQQALGKLKNSYRQQAENAESNGGMMDGVLRAVGAGGSVDARQASEKKTMEDTLETMKLLTEAIVRTTDAINKHGDAAETAGRQVAQNPIPAR